MVLPYWPEPELPHYKPGKLGRWACMPTPPMQRPTSGYFLPHKRQAAGWMFKRDNRIWMSLTKMETESQAPMIAAARGHTVIAGLGMGFALYNIAKKPEVTRVTLLEIDPEVIGLLDKVSDWRDWPGNDKVELVIGDASVYAPDAPVDFLFADIWPWLGDDDAVPLTQAIQANVRATRVGWWGQELDFVDYCNKHDVPPAMIDRAVYRDFARHVCLPVIEQDSLYYPRLCLLAATVQAAASHKNLAEKAALQSIAGRLIEEDPLDLAIKKAMIVK